MTGVIFDIKRFAVHDGGGLRSTLFLKGCPLHCPWCQNPEGMKRAPWLWYSPQECLRCGTCVAACPHGALTLDDRIHVNRERCDLCGICEKTCPGGALERTGREIEAEEAARILLRDRVFFGEHGGVTLSGGEALSQWKFAVEVLARCKKAGVDTAVETCLYAPREAVEAMIPVTDHFLIDIKILDPELHRKYLGVDNHLILENYEMLVRRGADVLVRTPLIPDYTAFEDNIRGIAHYIYGVDPDAEYELLNFNPLCRSKYAALEEEYPVEGGILSAEEMAVYYAILREEGIPHIIKE